MSGAAATIELAHTIVGIVGNITSFGLYLAPLPTIIQIVRWRSTKEFSGIPYLATLLNALLWVLYGLPFIHPHSMLIATVNIAGAAVQLAYIAIFIVYATKSNKMKEIYILLGMIVSLAIIVVLTLLFAHTYELRTLIVGSICVIVGIVMYGAPLSVMGQVIRTKSVEYMPFNVSFVAFLNCVVWSTYAGLHFDIFISLTNGVGVVLTASQLVLYAMYCGNKTSATVEVVDDDVEKSMKSLQDENAKKVPQQQKDVEAQQANECNNQIVITTIV